MKNKFKYIFLLVLCLVAFCSTDAYAVYTITATPTTNVPWVFTWTPSGYRRGPNVTGTFIVTDENGDSRDTFCLQSCIRTEINVQYNNVYIPGATGLSGIDLGPISQISTYYPENTAQHYWNDILTPETKRSLNIAYVWWKTYYPNLDAATAATQMFIWSQTQGCAGQYLEDHISSGYRDESMHAKPYHIDNGYTFLNRDMIWDFTYHPEKIITLNGITPDTSAEKTTAALEYYDKLVQYYESYNDNLPQLVKTSGNDVLHPGETIEFTDQQHQIHNEAEWTIEAQTPAGVSVVRNGDKITVSATNDYRGSNEISIKIIRYKNTHNNGSPRIYSNSIGNQILFEGGLPRKETELKVKATSLKLKLVKEGEMPSGHAVLNGAQYHVWNDDNSYDTTLTIQKDENGEYTVITGWIEPGNYHVQETKAPTGYNLNDEVYDITLTDENCNTVVVSQKVQDYIKRYALNIIKYDNQNPSEKTAAAGAVLVLSLDTEGITLENGEHPEPYELEVTLDDYGRATFKDETYFAKYGGKYTIPYGTYTLSEKKTSNEYKPKTRFFVQPSKVDLTGERDKTEQLRILDDEDVEANLKITKINKVTKEVVKDSGAKFKIWSVEQDDWVALFSYVDGKSIDEFEANEQGYLVTPEALPSGEYRVYETQAPEGYYLEDEYRIPEDESQCSKKGKVVNIDLDSLKLPEDTEYPEGGTYSGQFIVEVEMEDTPLYVNLAIEKYGQELVDRTNKSEKIILNNIEYSTEDVAELIYDYRNLQGVTYEIYTAEDIKWSPKGSIRWTEGTKVYTMETNEKGIAQSRKDLSPGKYRIVEVKAPAGVLLNKEIPDVDLTNTNSYVASADFKSKLNNDKQKLGLQFTKVFEDATFSEDGEEPVKEAAFGVYAEEDLKGYNDTTLIYRDDLVDIITVKGNNVKAKSNAYLPAGKYYVKELYTTYPYSVSQVITHIELTYDENAEDEYKVVDSDPFINTEDGSKITFLKLSKSSGSNVVLNGQEIQNDDIDSIVAEILKELTAGEEDYKNDEDVITVEGADYQLFKKETCKPEDTYYMLKDGKYVPAVFTTDKDGLIIVDKLPAGQYYMKEVKAPSTSKLSNEVFSFTVNQGTEVQSIFKVAVEEDTVSKFIHKTDIFTGDGVPNCLFEITDKDGKVKVRCITDEKGDAYFSSRSLKDGETYYFQEISVDNDVYYEDEGVLYELNTEKHEFVAHIEDGKWVGEQLEAVNNRPVTQVELIKTDDEGNRVPNCKFELKSVEEGLFYEVGVTDKDGIYVFKNVPKGEYIYTELEAPEEYEIDTTPHEIYVKGDKMVIEFVNTGDIQVVLLVCVALVCIAGIAYLVVKKVKASKK